MSDSDMEESVDALINNIQYWGGDDYKDYFRELESIDEYKVEVDIELPTIQLTRLEMLKWCWENIRDNQSAKRQNEIIFIAARYTSGASVMYFIISSITIYRQKPAS